MDMKYEQVVEQLNDNTSLWWVRNLVQPKKITSKQHYNSIREAIIAAHKEHLNGSNGNPIIVDSRGEKQIKIEVIKRFWDEGVV